MFKVYEKPCENCLFTENRIVPPERASEVIKDSIENQTHFICHKSTMGDARNGDQVCCSKFYDEAGSKIQKIRLAKRLGIVDFVKLPDTGKLFAHKDTLKQH